MGAWPVPRRVTIVMPAARPRCWPPRPPCGRRCGPRCARPGGQVPRRGRADPELHRRRGRRRAAARHAAVAGGRNGEGQPGLRAAAGAPARAGGRQDRVHGRPAAGRAGAVLRARSRPPERAAPQGGLDQRGGPVRPAGHAGGAVAGGPGGDGQRGGRRGRGPARQGRRVRRPGVRAGVGGGLDRAAHRVRHDRARASGARGRDDPADRPRRPGGLHRHARARHRLPRRARPAAGPRHLLGGPDRGEDRGHSAAGGAARRGRGKPARSLS